MTFADKDQARSASIAGRRAMNSENRRDAELALSAHDWSQIIGFGPATCYVSMGDEPGTAELRAHLGALRIEVFVPVMQPDRRLLWGRDNDDMTLNAFGIFEPEPEDVDLANFSALIIPGLRMGRDGTRLGRGAGYYDRVLNSLPRMNAGGPIRVGIVFDDELDDTVPHEAHDSALDVVVTPSSVYWI